MVLRQPNNQLILLLLAVAALVPDGCLSSTTTAARPSGLPLLGNNVKQSINTWFRQRWHTARRKVLLEQAVDDYNGDYVATAPTVVKACEHRRLIALPLSEETFDPPMGAFSHGHVQTGDKMSLPQNFWTAIQLSKPEVPWLFCVSRIPETEEGQHPHAASSSADSQQEEEGETTTLVTPPRVEFCDGKEEEEEDGESGEHQEDLSLNTIVEHIPADRTLNKVVGGILDFRAPPSYIFLPLWMMRALGIRPGEVVQVDMVTKTPAGSLARLRPHSKTFSKEITNPQAVLEMELRHYSSLTKGSTIAMDYNKKRYWFDIVDCKAAPKGESVPFVKAQDCDIATDWLPDRETRREQILARKKKLQQQREEDDD